MLWIPAASGSSSFGKATLLALGTLAGHLVKNSRPLTPATSRTGPNSTIHVICFYQNLDINGGIRFANSVR